MSIIIRVARWLKKITLLVVMLVCAVAIIWGMLYKLFLPFTPMWLDEITIVAGASAFVIAWLIGRPVEDDDKDKDSKPLESVPDAAVQLASDSHPNHPVAE